MWYKNIVGRFVGLLTKHACDRQTDGQNYDSQDRISIAASRCKNHRCGISKYDAYEIVCRVCKQTSLKGVLSCMKLQMYV